MTPEQIALVKSSMAALSDGDDVVRRFYDRLFELAPETRALFPESLEAQRVSFLATLRELVDSLDELPDFALQSRALGARHRGYGVHATHYRAVRTALIEALASSIDDFTDEHAEAWGHAYDLMSEVMQQGASAAGQGPTLASRRRP